MIKKNRSCVVLIAGLPGSGKTYYAREHLGNGIVYDLDHIAAAFRLKEPHSERHDAARMLANDLLKVFADQARKRASKVFIIRTAPDASEIEAVHPDKIVICEGKYNITARPDYIQINREDYLRRLQTVRNIAQRYSIPVEEV